MYNEEKETWISALKSDIYKKSKTYLKVEKNGIVYFSMMGIFCDLFKPLLKSDWIKSPFSKPHEEEFYYFLGQTHVFPKILADKLHVTPKEFSAIVNCQEEFKEKPNFDNEIIFLTNLK